MLIAKLWDKALVLHDISQRRFPVKWKVPTSIATSAVADDKQITAEGGGSTIAALWPLARNISAHGLLYCARMSGQWRESGLSQNTGWGYLGLQQLMHFLEGIRAAENVDIVGGLSREKRLAAQIVTMEQAPGRNGGHQPAVTNAACFGS